MITGNGQQCIAIVTALTGIAAAVSGREIAAIFLCAVALLTAYAGGRR